MKRYYSLFLFFFVFIASSCIRLGNQGTPKGYVRYCVRLLDRQALYSDSPQWRQTKDSILLVSKNISSFDEAHSLVSRAAHIAGGKHSQLLPPVKDTASYQEIAPEVKLMENGIVYVLLPAHSGIKVSDSLYLHTVLDFLLAHQDAQGVVLDLRGNRGGNMDKGKLLSLKVIKTFTACH